MVAAVSFTRIVYWTPQSSRFFLWMGDHREKYFQFTLIVCTYPWQNYRVSNTPVICFASSCGIHVIRVYVIEGRFSLAADDSFLGICGFKFLTSISILSLQFCWAAYCEWGICHHKKKVRSITTKCFFSTVYLYSLFLIFCLAVFESDASLVVLSMLFLFFSFCFLQKNVDV